MKTMYMHFHVSGNRRKSTTEEILNTHVTGQRVFWEVYNGDGLLSKTFARNRWKVRSFDISNGWDFEKAANRRAFMELQDQECPDFIWYAPPMQEVVDPAEPESAYLGSDRGVGSWTCFPRSYTPTALLPFLHGAEARRTACWFGAIQICLLVENQNAAIFGGWRFRQHLGPVPVWHHVARQLWELDVY